MLAGRWAVSGKCSQQVERKSFCPLHLERQPRSRCWSEFSRGSPQWPWGWGTYCAEKPRQCSLLRLEKQRLQLLSSAILVGAYRQDRACSKRRWTDSHAKGSCGQIGGNKTTVRAAEHWKSVGQMGCSFSIFRDIKNSVGCGLEQPQLTFMLPVLWVTSELQRFISTHCWIVCDFRLLHDTKEKSSSGQAIRGQKIGPLLEGGYSSIINRNCYFSINDW